jgi:hypothetical protein
VKIHAIFSVRKRLIYSDIGPRPVAPADGATRTCRQKGDTMTPRNCHNCSYSYFDFKMLCAGFSPGFPHRPLCANHPDSPGRLREAPGAPCRNYHPKPARDASSGPGQAIRHIPLSRGRFAIVDAADYEWLSQYRWTCRGGANPYAARSEAGKIIWMHREIMQTPPGMVCDHIDAVSLNNRRCNLRNCNRGENAANASKRPHATSCYKGVSWDKRSGKWRAKIKWRGKAYYLGYFAAEIDAARAYDQKARELFGPYARLNFPDAVG